jgi:hypothetical protein
MILDKENMFSLAQAVTATAASTNAVDLGKGDAGPSERISLFVSADPPFTVTGAPALAVELQTSDAVSAGALVSPVTVATYTPDNDALAAGGRLVAARLPHGMKRYAALNFKVTASQGNTLAAGKLTAGLVRDVQAEKTAPLP